MSILKTQKPGRWLGFCFNYLSVALLVAAFAVSCEKLPEPDPYDDTHAAKIEVNRTSCEAGSDSSRFILRVKSTYLWKIEIPEEADWITCDPMSGDSSDSFTKVYFYIDKNEGTVERTAKVLVRSGKARKTITVTQARKAKTLSEDDVDVSKIYIPQELRGVDLYTSSSKWYYGRSKQSDHFIVFWMAGDNWDEYGETTTPTNSPSAAYKVNIDDLLKKAELFYETYITKLKFADVGEGKSYLDKYKMMIFLNYQTEWLATGAGYDNVIGALWVSPNTCQPTGSTIAHEIGHSFQYQVYCDHLLNGGVDNSKSGWRYGFGGGGGNAFWEQTAQWQSFQMYPDQMFNNYYFQEYLDECHYHMYHEDPRYANYFIHSYWIDKRGIEEIATLWKESYSPEDPTDTYMRLHHLTDSQFNDEYFDYARRMATWDVEPLRTLGKSYIGKHTWKYTSVEDGFLKVSPAKCPQTTGYNIIALKIPSAGSTVKADFVGITSDSDFRIINPENAGWRYGFVSYSSDGTRVYSDIFSSNEGEASFTIPDGCTKLWFVVTGAPTVYNRHAWDDNPSNDEQWPYKVKFTGTSVK